MPTEKTTERWAEYETAGDVNRYIAQLEKQMVAQTTELDAALAACAAFRAWLREPPALIPGGSLVEVARLVDAALAAKP